MKKFISLLLLQCALFGLYNGNPAEPQIIDKGFFIAQDSLFNFKVGYQGDWVYDRKLRAFKTARGRIDRFEIWINQGVATLSLLDRIELYGSAGSMKAEISHRPHSDGKHREYQTHDKWTAGIGMRVLLMQWKHTSLGIDGKFQYGEPPVTWGTVNGVAFRTPGGRLLYREYQVSAGFAQAVDIFTPYAAVTYSNVHASFEGLDDVIPHHHFKMRSRDHFGLALGCTFSSGKKFDFNIEARVLDEQAVTAAGNIKF